MGNVKANLISDAASGYEGLYANDLMQSNVIVERVCPKIAPPSECWYDFFRWNPRQHRHIRHHKATDSWFINAFLRTREFGGKLEQVQDCIVQGFPRSARMQTPAVYVNVDKHVERRQRMDRILPKLFRHVYRSSAPVPQEWLRSMTNNFTTGTFSEEDRRNPEWGPTSGHYQALVKAREVLRKMDSREGNSTENSQGHRTVPRGVVVLEDDASFGLMPLWTQSIDDLLESLPDHWHVVQLGANPPPREEQLFEANRRGARYTQGTPGWGAFAYAISRRGLDLILDPARGPHYLVRHCGLVSADDCLLGFGQYRFSITRDTTTFARHYGGTGTGDLFSVTYTAAPPLIGVDTTGPSVVGHGAPHEAMCEALHLAAVANPNGKGWLERVFEREFD
jgi:hypothetical protein